MSLFARGLGVAVLAAVVAFKVMTLLRTFDPPGVALALYPVLLHPGNWFPLLVVLPFTVIAVGSAALISRLVDKWHEYPKPLGKGSTQLRNR
jgi:CBS-domain-containing membrane protein